MKSVEGLLSFLPSTSPASFSKPSCNIKIPLPPSSSSSSSSSSSVLPFNSYGHNYFSLKSHNPQLNLRKKCLVLARASDDNNTSNKEGDGSTPSSKEELKDNDGNGIGGANGGENGKNGNGRPRLNLKWVDLLLDPDPDNVVAVGLTGVLAWASVQVLWQLFVISVAILLAALKYSFIAALLVFILITLL